MKKYELVCVFKTKENQYVAGLERVKEIVTSNGAVINGDEDMKDRELAYPIQKEDRGHFHLLLIDAEPVSIIEMEKDLKLTQSILRYLFVKKD